MTEKLSLKKKVKGKITRPMFWVKGVGVFALLIFFYAVGNEAATISLEEEKVTLNELTSKVDKKKSEVSTLEDTLNSLEDEIKEQESKLSKKKKDLEAAEKLIQTKDALKKDLSALESDYSNKESDLANINKEIEAKQKELDAVKGDIVKAASDPIQISSGQWVVGQDIPPGRYQASGSSNFVVYSSLGALKVNTILGDSSVGDGDYVFFAEEGDYIETSSATTLTPIE